MSRAFGILSKMMNGYQKAANYIKERGFQTAKTALILGSGLGGFADHLSERVRIPYSEIPGFPHASVPGHKGELVMGTLHGVPVLCMNGRFHYYEGYSMEELGFPIHVLCAMGVETLILTNAAGGIREDFMPGTLMLLSDHLKLSLDSPLRGKNDDSLGTRFFDVSDCYNKALRTLAHATAKELGIPLCEGVYAYMGGPNYETPAEIKMLCTLGADAVGMSTVPEALAAVHDGMRVLGISLITNQAAGMGEAPLSHEEVTHAGERASEEFARLLGALIPRI